MDEETKVKYYQQVGGKAALRGLLDLFMTLVWEASRPWDEWSFAMNCYYDFEHSVASLHCSPWPEDFGSYTPVPFNEGIWTQGTSETSEFHEEIDISDDLEETLWSLTSDQYWCFDDENYNLHVKPRGLLHVKKIRAVTGSILMRWLSSGEDLELERVAATFQMRSPDGSSSWIHKAALPIHQDEHTVQYVDLLYDRSSNPAEFSVEPLRCFVHAVYKARVRQ